jgi:glycosyltransferase involved in cell wall biosynthesis
MLHAIVLTLNEQRHIARCLKSLQPYCETVLVVDSGSSDETTTIAEELGATVVINRFVSHAQQVNFAIDRLGDRDGWIIRVDADEVLSASDSDVQAYLSAIRPDVDGLLVRRRIHFLGKPMQWGGMGALWQLRVWRAGRGRCEPRLMDEHIITSGGVRKSPWVLDDINLNSLSWWTEKHNRYATLEAVETLALRYSLSNAQRPVAAALAGPAAAKRWLKVNVYLRLGSGFRALLYFLYRYILRLGFADGVQGWYFHFLQAFWYRTLVDAKVEEISRTASNLGLSIAEAIEFCTGLDPDELLSQPNHS